MDARGATGAVRDDPFGRCVDLRDPAAERGELLLDVLHASLFLCSLYNTARQRRSLLYSIW